MKKAMSASEVLAQLADQARAGTIGAFVGTDDEGKPSGFKQPMIARYLVKKGERYR